MVAGFYIGWVLWLLVQGAQMHRVEHATAMGADVHGNVFVADADGQVRFFPADTTQPPLRYENRALGAVSAMDVSDPLRPLIYYGNFASIIVLDNHLAELRQLNLEQLGFFDVTAICRGHSGQIWLFDAAEQQLVRLNLNGEVAWRSLAFHELGLELTPKKLMFSGGLLFAFVPGKPVAVFDDRGSYKHQIALPAAKDIYPFGAQLYYGKAGGLWRYDRQQLQHHEVLAMTADFFAISPGSVHWIHGGVLRTKSLP